jgi:DNA-binding transcriptional LysR family regulator
MTLTQLNAFVLVARLGSVTAAANALGVSESAVSQALSALRLHLGDQLVTRGPVGMTLTAGGSRLLATASQIVVLGAEAHAAVRAAQGAPEQLRLVSTSTIAEFVISPLTEAFTKRFPGSVEVSAGVAVTKEMSVLVANRLADVAIAPTMPDDATLALATEPIFKFRLVVVTAGQPRLRGNPRQWLWFVDPSGTDPGSADRPDADRSAHSRGTSQGLPEPDRRLGGRRRRHRRGARGRAPGRPATAPRRALPRRSARLPDGCVLVRHPAGTAASERGGQFVPPLSGHPRGHAPDAFAGRRGSALAVPAAGLRHDLELRPRSDK